MGTHELEELLPAIWKQKVQGRPPRESQVFGEPDPYFSLLSLLNFPSPFLLPCLFFPKCRSCCDVISSPYPEPDLDT